MKVNKIDLQNTIEEIIANGVAHCEEIDLTTKKVMVCIEPLMLAVQNLSSKSENQRLKTEREWISVKDRLPEFGEEYNCVQILEDGGHPVTSITEFDAIKKIFCYPGTDVIQSGITHWMPLPEPPKQ